MSDGECVMRSLCETSLNLRTTCGCELHVPLHKRFPLLLKKLAWNEPCAASLYVTGLGGKTETQLELQREREKERTYI